MIPIPTSTSEDYYYYFFSRRVTAPPSSQSMNVISSPNMHYSSHIPFYFVTHRWHLVFHFRLSKMCLQANGENILGSAFDKLVMQAKASINCFHSCWTAKCKLIACNIIMTVATATATAVNSLYYLHSLFCIRQFVIAHKKENNE